ncbi:MAG: Dam family site-specific DNA-(adenine-N6)-methyltransferase [Syntrophaceae bacterium]
MRQKEQVTFLRYPGGKRRLLSFLSVHLPSPLKIEGKYIEPFVGGGSIYFYLKPRKAILSDINSELIDLYRGIRANPEKVWKIYEDLPSDKNGYNEIRKLRHSDLDLHNRAARTLFLNRTCFKGMWRHNAEGEFNVGYGGQARRWVIEKEHLVQVSKLLKRASLKCSDFEYIIDESKSEDYLFLDPPYRPGEREQLHAHYVGREFTFTDHKRLARCLKKADKRGVAWSMTISGHSDIVMMYKKFHIQKIPLGTGRKIGVLEENSGEVLISNHNGELK